MYLLKIGLRPWRLAPWSQLFNCITLGALVVLMTLLFWLFEGSKPLINKLKGENVITAYLKSGLESQEEKKVLDSINLALGASQKKLRVVQPEQFLEEIKTNQPKLARQLVHLGSEMDSLVPKYVQLQGTYSQEHVQKLGAIDGVESVDSSESRLRPVLNAVVSIRWGALALAIGMVFAVITAMIHIVRSHHMLQSETLEQFRLWGADALSLAIPCLMSTILVSVIAAMFCGLVWLGIGNTLVHSAQQLSPLLGHLQSPNPMTLMMFVGGLITLGVGMSLFSRSIASLE